MARLLSVLFLLGLGSAIAQDTRASDTALMQALLSEVRQLRLALERSALEVPRIQVALQRVQFQQGRVDRLSSQLESLRRQMADSASQDARLAADVRDAESRVGQEQDAARRKEMELRIRAAKSELEQRAARDEQQRGYEAELSSQFNTEQAKLNELSDELSRLEKALGPPPAP